MPRLAHRSKGVLRKWVLEVSELWVLEAASKLWRNEKEGTERVHFESEVRVVAVRAQLESQELEADKY